MLIQIIATKTDFIRDHGSNVIDISSFISELSIFTSTRTIDVSSLNPYWNNYFHSVLIAAFFDSTQISLERWNDYFNNSTRITQILNLSYPNEGEVLELFVMHSINHAFSFNSNLNIKALKANNSRNPTYLTDDSNNPNLLTAAENERIIDNLKVVMKLRGLPTKKIWGDNDIIVVLKHNNINQQFCIISCKTSLRERVYQSIFWATHSRLEGTGKHVFVTTDKGASGNSEIGNRDANNNAKKSRDVLESTMDRVYVLRNNNEVERAQVIKDFLHLNLDLDRWASDIAGF